MNRCVQTPLWETIAVLFSSLLALIWLREMQLVVTCLASWYAQEHVWYSENALAHFTVCQANNLQRKKLPSVDIGCCNWLDKRVLLPIKPPAVVRLPWLHCLTPRILKLTFFLIPSTSLAATFWSPRSNLRARKFQKKWGSIPLTPQGAWLYVYYFSPPPPKKCV